MNVQKVQFELLAYTWEVSADGRRFDVVGHVDCEEAKGVLGGFKQKII